MLSRRLSPAGDEPCDRPRLLLFRAPTGLADGLALKELRYDAAEASIRPNTSGSPAPHLPGVDSAMSDLQASAAGGGVSCGALIRRRPATIRVPSRGDSVTFRWATRAARSGGGFRSRRRSSLSRATRISTSA